jgi:nicotinamidase-related amidase
MGNLVGYGESPVLIVIDLQKGFTNADSPLGSDLSGVVEWTNELLDTAHAAETPVVFTRIVTRHPDGADLGAWVEKASTLMELAEGTEWVEIDDRLHVQDNDYVLEKKQASAFHETELDSMLAAWGVDTAIVTGCTTSGCVRATVVDACSHGYRTIVPKESVGDRAPEPHEANLFDMHKKYADIRPVTEVLDYLNG